VAVLYSETRHSVDRGVEMWNYSEQAPSFKLLSGQCLGKQPKHSQNSSFAKVKNTAEYRFGEKGGH